MQHPCTANPFSWYFFIRKYWLNQAVLCLSEEEKSAVRASTIAQGKALGRVEAKKLGIVAEATVAEDEAKAALERARAAEQVAKSKSARAQVETESPTSKVSFRIRTFNSPVL